MYCIFAARVHNYLFAARVHNIYLTTLPFLLLHANSKGIIKKHTHMRQDFRNKIEDVKFEIKYFRLETRVQQILQIKYKEDELKEIEQMRKKELRDVNEKYDRMCYYAQEELMNLKANLQH